MARTHFTTVTLPANANVAQIMLRPAYCGAKATMNAALYMTEDAHGVDCLRCIAKLEAKAEREAAKAAQQEREIEMAQVAAGERVDVATAAFEVALAEIAAPVATPASTDAMNRKAARLASLKDRLEAATSRRVARGETTANKSEMTLAQKIEGVEAWIANN